MAAKIDMEQNYVTVNLCIPHFCSESSPAEVASQTGNLCQLWVITLRRYVSTVYFAVVVRLSMCLSQTGITSK